MNKLKVGAVSCLALLAVSCGTEGGGGILKPSSYYSETDWGVAITEDGNYSQVEISPPRTESVIVLGGSMRASTQGMCRFVFRNDPSRTIYWAKCNCLL